MPSLFASRAKGCHGWFVVTSLQAGYGGLLHPELAGERGLRQPMFHPVLNDKDGKLVGHCSARQFGGHLRVAHVLGYELIPGLQLRQFRHHVPSSISANRDSARRHAAANPRGSTWASGPTAATTNSPPTCR